MPKITLTASFVQSPPVPATAKVDYFDTQVPGFMLEVRKTGNCTYYHRYRDKGGRLKQYRIGPVDSISLDDARQRARLVRSQNILGVSPNMEVEKYKNSPLFKDFVKTKYLPFTQLHKRSWEQDKRSLERRMLPLWGHKRLIEFTRDDFIELQLIMRAGGSQPGTVNRNMALAKYIFNLAVRWDYLSASPAMGVKMLEDNDLIERFLTDDEIDRLLTELKNCRSPIMPDLIEFLILTGARRGEASNMQWEDVDMENSMWTVPISKSGKPRHIPLSGAAVNLLLRRKPLCEGSKYVFPNPKTGKPLRAFHSTWDTIRKNAGIPDVRIHDLRHNFASLLINSGRTLYEVQKLLGHSNSRRRCKKSF